MLSKDQKAQIQKGFDIGLSDKHIARAIPSVNHMQVFNYRHKLGISSQTIVQKRYDVWKHLIYKGMSISKISQIYGVGEQSIKVLLWKNKNISLVDAKAAVQAERKASVASPEIGIPDFGEYGL